MMTDEQQYREVDAYQFKYGYSTPWELQLREIAKRAVDHRHTYLPGGYCFPVRAPEPPYPSSHYRTIQVRLAPGLEGDPYALLIAEKQIRDQTKDLLELSYGTPS